MYMAAEAAHRMRPEPVRRYVILFVLTVVDDDVRRQPGVFELRLALQL